MVKLWGRDRPGFPRPAERPRASGATHREEEGVGLSASHRAGRSLAAACEKRREPRSGGRGRWLPLGGSSLGDRTGRFRFLS